MFIRTLPELKKIAALESFDEPQIRGASVNVIILAERLDETSIAKLRKPGTSFFARVPLANVLHDPFTIRSRNTIRKLVAKCR